MRDRPQAEEFTRVLREVFEGTAATLGEDFLRALIRHLAGAMDVRYAMITENIDSPTTRVRTLGMWNGRAYMDDFEYALDGTPCERVYQEKEAFCPARVQELYPRDQDLVTLRAESYFGVLLCDRRGTALGHLAVLDDRPMSAEDLEARRCVLRIFAARAGAELERSRIERELAEVRANLERTVAALSTPILQVWRGTVALPLIGAIDQRRAAIITQSLMDTLVATRARHALIDLTGVEYVDTSTADHLLRIIRAIALLGVQGIVTGIQPRVANTFAGLGVDLSRLRTFRSMEDGLAFCMREASQGRINPGTGAPSVTPPGDRSP